MLTAIAREKEEEGRERKNMVKLWLLRGLKKGILTTKYPRNAPTSEELPSSSAPPEPLPGSDWKLGRSICPTGAIHYVEETGRGQIDLGRCIYCQRCSEAGFEFTSQEEKSRNLRATYAPHASQEPSERELLVRYDKVRRVFGKSLHVLMIDVGSCNACNLEVLTLGNPYYDLNRLGIFFTNSPKHADALVVVGALNKAMVDILKRTYDSIPFPKVVVSVGACPISGGIFQRTEGFACPVADIIPVDVEIPGCPPTPIQILQGLLIAMGKARPTSYSQGTTTTIDLSTKEMSEELNRNI